MDKPNPEYRPVDETDPDANKPVLTPVESRGGIMTGRVRWILGTSLALVIIAMVSLYAVNFGSNAHMPLRTGQVHSTALNSGSGRTGG